MIWVKASERLSEANSDYYVVSVTKGHHTFLAVGLYMRYENIWYYMDQEISSDVVIEKVDAWIEKVDAWNEYVGPY